MEVKDGIVYGDAPLLKVLSVRPLENNRLEICFSTHETGIFDMTPFLDRPAFMPLRDKSVFNSVYVDFGTVTWLDGNIDIDPETLYAKSSLYPRRV